MLGKQLAQACMLLIVFGVTVPEEVQRKLLTNMHADPYIWIQICTGTGTDWLMS